jgi:hypothetical protein
LTAFAAAAVSVVATGAGFVSVDVVAVDVVVVAGVVWVTGASADVCAEGPVALSVDVVVAVVVVGAGSEGVADGGGSDGLVSAGGDSAGGGGAGVDPVLADSAAGGGGGASCANADWARPSAAATVAKNARPTGTSPPDRFPLAANGVSSSDRMATWCLTAVLSSKQLHSYMRRAPAAPRPFAPLGASGGNTNPSRRCNIGTLAGTH